MSSKIFWYARVSSKEQNEMLLKNLVLMKETFILINKVVKILIEIII